MLCCGWKGGEGGGGNYFTTPDVTIFVYSNATKHPNKELHSKCLWK